MRKRINIWFWLIVIVTTACNIDETPDFEGSFYKLYGGQNVEEGMDLIETDDNGFLLVGYTTSDTSGVDKDAFIVKTDPAGQSEWILIEGGAGEDQAVKVKKTLDGSYVVVGTLEVIDSTFTHNDVFLLKISANGNLIWKNNYNFRDELTNRVDNYRDEGVDVLPMDNGNILVVGNTLFEDQSGTQWQSIVFEVDADGNMVSRFFDFGYDPEDDENIDDRASAIIKDQTDRNAVAIIFGTTEATEDGLGNDTEGENLFLLPFNENFQEFSNQPFGGANNQQAAKVIYVPNNQLVVFGTENQTQNGQSKLFFRKLISNMVTGLEFDASFELQLNEPAIENIRGGSFYPTDNGYILVGTREVNTADFNVIIIKTDLFGNEIWRRSYGGEYRDEVNSVIVTSDGNLALTGRISFSPADQNTKMFLIKMNEEGNLEVN